MSEPVLSRGTSDSWDSTDVLNPSVVLREGRFYNLYSGFDGETWHTGLAESGDGLEWKKKGRVLTPDPQSWEGSYIAANGSAILHEGEWLYWYQSGPRERVSIGLARSPTGVHWQKGTGPVLTVGPRGSFDETAVADPYAIRVGEFFYMYYLGQDRARRQRLGVARSKDGIHWEKFRGNPVLDLGEHDAFDEIGLGEPALWSSHGWYWMLYTGRDSREWRRMGLARSADGITWERRPLVIEGSRPWDKQVVCDPSVILSEGRVRVWFGGGNKPSPDENLNGQIGFGELIAE